MSRTKNDGRGRIGGRQKGTPNKANANIKEYLSALIDRNKNLIEEDLLALEPKDRLQMIEKLLPYVVPKQQAVAASITQLTDTELSGVAGQVLNSLYDDGED